MHPFNISGVDGEKECEQGNGAVDFTALITYKNTLEENKKPVTVYLALGEWVACNTIFSWLFMQTIKSLIMTENNALVSGLLGEQFRMEMMVPQRAKEAPKTSEGITV